MTPNISLAGPSDLAQIVRLLGAQLREHDIPATEDGLEKAVGGMLEDPRRGDITVARLGGRVVGIAIVAYNWTVEHGGLSCWLDELYVEPELRSRGIGRALLGAAIERARSLGAAAVDLEVAEGHERATRLYEREGFQRHRRVRWVLPL